MTKPCLLAFFEDPSFRSRIQEVATLGKIEVHFTAQGDQLTQLAKTIAPFMMIVDLSGLDSEWIFRHISAIKFLRPNLPIVAHISRDQEEVRDRAEKYGCSQILEASDLFEHLPVLIEKCLRQGM